MIREATFSDIPRLVEIAREAADRSKYAETNQLDERRVKSMFFQAIQRHGAPHGTLVMVEDHQTRVEGVIVGIAMPVYQVFDGYEATDLFFYCTKNARPTAPLHLLKAFDQWADARPEISYARPTMTDAVDGADFARKRKIYEGLGYKLSGLVFERRAE